MKIHFLLDCFISKDKVMIRNERVQCFLLVQNSSKQQYSFHIFVWFIYYLKQIFKRTEIFNSYRHCVKSVRIRSFSGSYFAAFGLNTERYTVFSPNYQTNSEYRGCRSKGPLPKKWSLLLWISLFSESKSLQATFWELCQILRTTAETKLVKSSPFPKTK